MTYVILGFLCLSSLTQYDILKALKMRISPFYQPSLGSIQATLKKLLADGLITQEAETQAGRKKKIFSITDEGRKAFETWMLLNDADMSLSKMDAELSTRLFFLGLMPPEDRNRIVGTAAAFFTKTLAECTQAYSAYRQTEYPQEMAGVVRFQLKTLSYAIHQLSSSLEWLHDFQKELEEA